MSTRGSSGSFTWVLDRLATHINTVLTTKRRTQVGCLLSTAGGKPSCTFRVLQVSVVASALACSGLMEQWTHWARLWVSSRANLLYSAACTHNSYYCGAVKYYLHGIMLQFCGSSGLTGHPRKHGSAYPQTTEPRRGWRTPTRSSTCPPCSSRSPACRALGSTFYARTVFP